MSMIGAACKPIVRFSCDLMSATGCQFASSAAITTDTDIEIAMPANLRNIPEGSTCITVCTRVCIL
jgi:hypothetical protein